MRDKQGTRTLSSWVGVVLTLASAGCGGLVRSTSEPGPDGGSPGPNAASKTPEIVFVTDRPSIDAIAVQDERIVVMASDVDDISGEATTRTIEVVRLADRSVTTLVSANAPRMINPSMGVTTTDVYYPIADVRFVDGGRRRIERISLEGGSPELVLGGGTQRDFHTIAASSDGELFGVWRESAGAKSWEARLYSFRLGDVSTREGYSLSYQGFSAAEMESPPFRPDGAMLRPWAGGVAGVFGPRPFAGIDESRTFKVVTPFEDTLRFFSGATIDALSMGSRVILASIDGGTSTRAPLEFHINTVECDASLACAAPVSRLTAANGVMFTEVRQQSDTSIFFVEDEQEGAVNPRLKWLHDSTTEVLRSNDDASGEHIDFMTSLEVHGAYLYWAEAYRTSEGESKARVVRVAR